MLKHLRMSQVSSIVVFLFSAATVFCFSLSENPIDLFRHSEGWFPVSGIFRAGGILQNKRLLSRNFLFNFSVIFPLINNRVSTRSDKSMDYSQCWISGKITHENVYEQNNRRSDLYGRFALPKPIAVATNSEFPAARANEDRLFLYVHEEEATNS